MVRAVNVGAYRGAIIEHRIDEQLKGRLHLLAVVREERKSGGETSAGAHSADSNAIGVDVELRRP